MRVRKYGRKGMEHPCPPGVLSSQYSVYSAAQKLSKSHTLEVFTETSLHGNDRSLTHCPVPVPLLEDDGGSENSMFLIKVRSFSWPAPTLKLSRSPPRVISTKDTLVTQEIPELRSPVSRTGIKNQILQQKMFPVVFTLRKPQGI